ncbi:AbrB/MazE/SpoVT family DNA-binding domain-containing protein [Occallatibacter riparius]|uniref:AbrB/MazE/SpoVT family DNA-binding domain-containing protein n=1 Tax=Occallatibacter riparius TaxID=1002689 RepID=A0A9J7BSA1_9BACT|nr:AbrB/MazE/SpoVT family DNA-binding domain-containing protein [Occallatibacter riparius]UWZ85457.1 AbrB/MazE/SpoVT family DNA-binding domain-containing protein [Occallatibacter riparius]
MEIRLSTRGRVVIPAAIRKQLAIKPGDQLDASVEDDRVVLTRSRTGRFECEIVSDPVTGMPVISAGEDAPTLTSEQVAEILADFP